MYLACQNKGEGNRPQMRSCKDKRESTCGKNEAGWNRMANARNGTDGHKNEIKKGTER
jgi:hypothetical protein